jgi:hypothetical protein
MVRAGFQAALAVALLGPLVVPRAARADVRFRAFPDRSAYLNPLDDQPVGLPPAWHFTPNVTMGALPDPTVTVTLDPETGVVRESYRETNVEIKEPLVATGDEYTSLLTTRTRKKLWRDKFRSNRSVVRTSTRPGGLFRVELPVQLPPAVRAIVGDGAPNLEVSGSETITIGGTSNWTKSRTDYTGENKRQGAFPSFEMKQELNVNLTGSIGDKIKVDVDQSSNVQTSLDNKVKLRYEGDDDDMIKLIELGNTNLSLQGASIRQEGLFGVKAAAKMGNVDVTTIASKQEGKNETARFTPLGEKTHVILLDQDYIPRTYYALTDHATLIDYNQPFEIWKDSKSSDKTGTTPGLVRLDPTSPPDPTTNPQLDGNWKRMELGVDFFLDENRWILPSGLKVPVIRFTQRVGEYELLGVTYTEKVNNVSTKVGYGGTDADRAVVDTVLQKPAETMLLKMLKPAKADFGGDNPTTQLIDSTGVWYPTLKYELRNFYDLTARNITPGSMTFSVRLSDNSQSTNPDHPEGGKPYLQILGLDQTDVAGTGPPDGKIDLRFVDTELGVLWFPDINPFDPEGVSKGTCDPQTRFDLLCLNNYGNAGVPRPVDNSLNRGDGSANPLVYYRSAVIRSQDTRYYIDAEFQSSRQGYFLGRFDILEGSEVVKVDGVPMKSGLDYTVDYTTGQLTFNRVPAPEQTITVDYSFAPGAGAVQRTLLGFSAGYNPASNLSFSSSALYESKGAQEQLVKLGEEPATSLVGDFSTLLSFRPVWMTQLTNRVPFIQTSQASGLNIQGSIATSIPDPNTRGEAYVDDMEANKESNTFPLNRTQWMWSSVPAGMSTQPEGHAMLQWYNPVDPLPNAVDEHDLKPTLTKEEGGESQRQVLELNVRPPAVPDTNSTVKLSDWTGLTLSLGNVGQDLSRVQFIEIWVNDFRPDHAATQGTLHLNFGRVDEDAFWDPRNPPNNQLDTEDKSHDGRLDRRDPSDKALYLAEDEDTGLDGVHDELETGNGPSSDPNRDNYAYISGSKDFTFINNFEGNAINDPNARPDTEDLNHDGSFDRNNDYFETSLDLSGSKYVAIDVPRDYFGDPDVKPNNGWRLYRIPVDSIAVGKNANGTDMHPSWNNVQALRVWLDNMNAPTTLQIGGIEVIGNRWLKQASAHGDHFEVLTRNNKDDPFYEAPYEVQHNVGGTSQRREQSLALKYDGLASNDSVFAYKTVGDVGSNNGWTLYQEVRFYVHGDTGVTSQNLRAVARFGPDTVNFYEYSVPVRSGWQSIIVPMERLSSLKSLRRSNNFYIDRDTGAPTGEVYAVFGNPSFTRINRISFGLTIDGSPTATPVGEVWIDELRLSDVRKDRGISSNVSVQANFADLLSVNGSYNRTDEDFFRVGQGSTQGSGVDNTAIGLSSTLNLDRFMPTSGIQLPVRVSIQHSADVPKFRTGSDVILDPARSDVETRESNRRSIDMQYRRTSRSKGIARYTLDAITGNMEYSEQGSVNPQSRDSSWSFHTNGAYTALIGGRGLKLGPLPLRVNPIPQQFTVTTDWFSTRNVSHSRTLTDTSDVQELRSDVKQRLLTLNLVTAFEPLSGIRLKYNIQSTRDMLLLQQGYFGFNKGTEIRHTQSFGLDYRPRWLGLLQPQIAMNGIYNENASSEVRLSASDPMNLKNISNLGTANVSFVVPITRLAGKARGPKSGGGFLPIMPVRFILSKFENISVTGNLNRSAVMTRVTGDPGPAFKSGFTEVFDSDITPYNNSTFQTARGYTANANTNFHPLDRLTFDIRGEYLLNFVDQVGGSRRNVSVSWPNVLARWPELQRVLALSGPLSQLTLSSGLQRKITETGPEGQTFDTRIEQTTFTPLIGWEAVFRSGVRLTATTNLDKIRTFDDRSIGFFRDRRTLATTLALNRNFPASKGIKFPWSRTRVRLKNDLNLGLNVNLSADETLLYQRGARSVEVDRTSMQIGSSTNYNFTQTISGGFNLGYHTTTDQKLDNITRGITIAFTGSFRF